MGSSAVFENRDRDVHRFHAANNLSSLISALSLGFSFYYPLESLLDPQSDSTSSTRPKSHTDPHFALRPTSNPYICVADPAHVWRRDATIPHDFKSGRRAYETAGVLQLLVPCFCHTRQSFLSPCISLPRTRSISGDYPLEKLARSLIFDRTRPRLLDSILFALRPTSSHAYLRHRPRACLEKGCSYPR